jgi:hypothetical protein
LETGLENDGERVNENKRVQQMLNSRKSDDGEKGSLKSNLN